jgi:hypothetical protein
MSICEPAGAERRQVGAGAHGGENEGMQVAGATAGGPNRVPGMDRREPPAAFEIRRPSRGQEGEGCSPGVSPPTPRAAGEMVKDGESLLPSNPQKIKNAHPVFSLFCGEEPQPFHQVSPFHQLWTASAFHSVVPPAPGSPVATRLSREIARKQPPTRLPPRRSPPSISAAPYASLGIFSSTGPTSLALGPVHTAAHAGSRPGKSIRFTPSRCASIPRSQAVRGPTRASGNHSVSGWRR